MQLLIATALRLMVLTEKMINCHFCILLLNSISNFTNLHRLVWGVNRGVHPLPYSIDKETIRFSMVKNAPTSGETTMADGTFEFQFMYAYTNYGFRLESQ
jgi:hypothetical protein